MDLLGDDKSLKERVKTFESERELTRTNNADKAAKDKASKE